MEVRRVKYISSETLMENRGNLTSEELNKFLAGRTKIAWRTLADLPFEDAIWFICELRIGLDHLWKLVRDIAERGCPTRDGGLYSPTIAEDCLYDAHNASISDVRRIVMRSANRVVASAINCPRRRRELSVANPAVEDVVAAEREWLKQKLREWLMKREGRRRGVTRETLLDHYPKERVDKLFAGRKRVNFRVLAELPFMDTLRMIRELRIGLDRLTELAEAFADRALFFGVYHPFITQACQEAKGVERRSSSGNYAAAHPCLVEAADYARMAMPLANQEDELRWQQQKLREWLIERESDTITIKDQRDEPYWRRQVVRKWTIERDGDI
jgi:hypothetical protein